MARPEEVSRDELSAESERAVVCAACCSVVSHPKQRIEVQGRHEHTFLNPAGYVYRIGCYASVPGARPFGAPSDEYAWFKGYAWQMTVCHGCGEHLGWLFTGPGSCFWGLIVDRVREID